MYIAMILASIGLPGNIAIIYIFPKLKKVSCRRSIALLAFLDSISTLPLIAYVITMIIKGANVFLVTPLSCTFLLYYHQVTALLSVWTQTDISVQRTLIIKKISKNKTLIFLRIIVTGIILGGTSNVFKWLALIQTKVNSATNLTVDMCIHLDKSSRIETSTIYLLLILIIPAIIMLVCSIIIIKQIKKCRFLILQLKQPQSTKCIAKKDYKLSLTILLINLRFVVFNLPFCVVVFLFDANDVLFNVARIIFIIQFGFNFIIYYLIHKDFRKSFCHYVLAQP